MRKLTLILVLVPLAIQAQFKNTVIGETRNNIAGGVAVALNKKENKIIIIATPENVLYRTSDGGNAWEKMAFSSSVGVGGDPVLVSDRKGDFFNVHLSKAEETQANKIVTHFSKDGGLTWEEKGYLGAPDKWHSKPKAVVDRSGELYLSWIQYDKYKSSTDTDKSYAMFSRSKDGKKWDLPVVLSQEGGTCLQDVTSIQGATPGVNVDGLLFGVWSRNRKIYLDRAFDKKGDMWLTNDVDVTTQPEGLTNVSGVPHANSAPSMKIDNSEGRFSRTVFVSWADHRNGDQDGDIFFTRSTRYGDSWESAIRVNNDESGKQQFMPAMTVDPTTGFIYIVFYDRRNHEENQTDVYLAYSIDNGATFKNVKISETPFTPTVESFQIEYIGVEAYKGVIVPVWLRSDDGKVSVMCSVIKHEDLVKEKETEKVKEEQ